MREFFTDHAIANAIRLKRSSFVGAFLVVEGVTDKRVYGLVLDHERCSIEVAYGRDNLFGAIRILNAASFVGAFAIVDADFSNVTGEAIPEENVLQTDFHDLECMILNSPAFDRVLEELGSEIRVSSFATTTPLIARQLATNAIPLGCLRLHSLQQEMGLKFEGLTFGKFVEPSDLRIDLAKMVRNVVDNSQKHHLVQTQLVVQIEDEEQKGHDCWQISCGHDIVEILSVALRKKFSGKNSGEVAPENLERYLRLAYEAADLKETNLFQALVDWEQRHPEFAILDSS